MIKKNNDNLEERLLSTQEIDEKISELKKQKMNLLSKSIKPKFQYSITKFEDLPQDKIFDYFTYYEVTDLKNSTSYYLNGSQVGSLFGLNEEYKKQFAQKLTQGQAQLDDRIINFYYREVK